MGKGLFTSKKTRSTTDLNEICCEIENHESEDLIFDSIHAKRFLQPTAWLKIVCKAQDRVFLPHQYYNLTTKSGRPAKVTKHFGDQIKTRPQVASLF